MELLALAPVFRGLALEELAGLFREVRHQQVPRETTFHQPTDATTVLYFLKRGRVRLYRLTPEGRKVIITELRPPTAFLGQGMDGEFAEAVEESLICTVRLQALEGLLRRRPDVGLRLLELVGRRLWELTRRVEEMATLTAGQRLATVLLRLADAGGTVDGVTQEELGEMSGTVRQTVARILGAWERKEYVEVRRRSVRIIRRDRLLALVTPDRNDAPEDPADNTM
ncbi:MAG: Crp/Fnr family transcriptional regulator [Armatimonadetes bacterium]|nr:Crp/Fnr family transcriptional regulator [Armatimonadota bacterium]